MNNRPPPRLFHPTTTTAQILHKTTAVFFTRHHILPILFLSFLLLVIHNEMKAYADSITSFVDNDPSIKSQFPPKPTNPNLRQLTGDDVTGVDQSNQQFFEKTTKPKSNATPITLDSFKTRFSDAKLSFKFSTDPNPEIEHQDSSAFFARSTLYISYGFMILLYVLTQSTIHGLVFVLVANHVLKTRTRFMSSFRRGESLGQNRLWWFFLTRWVLMHSIVQILSLWFVKSHDRYSVFKIMVRMVFLPFSITFPVVKGFETETNRFTLSYAFSDTIMSFMFDVGVWVAMGDPRLSCEESYDEWGDLISLSVRPALVLKTVEVVATELVSRLVVTRVLGEVLGSFVRAYVSMYFMVVWMMYYFSVKSIDADAKGVPFGQKELEDMLGYDR